MTVDIYPSSLPAGTNNIGDVDVVTMPGSGTLDSAEPTTGVLIAVSGGGNLRKVTAPSTLGDNSAFGGLYMLSSMTYVLNGSGNPDRVRGDSTNGMDVDVTRLPALAAGTNNIGDVDILTVPADPFGANADAAVAAGAAGSIQAKLRRATQGLEDLKSLIVLAAGTNAIGKLAANSGVDIGDVDVLSLPALVAGSAVIGKVGIDQTTVGTTNGVTLVPHTAGGLTTYHLVSAGSTNAAVVKASAGQLYGWSLYNNNAAARKIAFHNASSTPTAGASVFFSVVLPPNAGANVAFPHGVSFSTGIAITTTTGIADSDSAAVAANDLLINLWYK